MHTGTPMDETAGIRSFAPDYERNRSVKTRDIMQMMDRYLYTDETRTIIANEKLLPMGLLSRLETLYPQHSGLLETSDFLFTEKDHYSGLSGFRKVVSILKENGIDIGYIKERELFIDVYRFMATKHALNTINWSSFETDSVFQLVIPQPGMINEETTQAYINAAGDDERKKNRRGLHGKNQSPRRETAIEQTLV